jgi:DNA mismatch endonuclease Vsr
MPNKYQQKFDDVPDIVRARMARIRKADTLPELVVRRVTHRLGYRFRLHRRDLPGTPDLVFPALRKVIQVNGCFWHQHTGCPSATIPQVRQAYWLPKLARNRARDYDTMKSLARGGWKTLVIWECETGDLRKLEAKLAKFLSRKD